MRKQKSSQPGTSIRRKGPAVSTEASPAESNHSTLSASTVADAARQAMIAEAAYYRAQKRGFVPGRELDDWLAAEAEISGHLLERVLPAAELH